MSSGLSLVLLGGLHITLDGISLEDRLTGKAAAMLVYLAVTGRPYGRVALASLLWGETADEKARASLRTALSALNRHVAPYLRITRQEVAFDPTRPHWIDARAFHEGLARPLAPDPDRPGALPAAEVDRLRELVRLYQGDFLAGCAIYDAPQFEAWLLGERERLLQLALQTLYRLSVHYAATGEYRTGIGVTEHLLVLAPWQEEAHRQLMWLLALDGQRGAALAQYEVCRRVLAEELGVNPTAETIALYEQIRQGDQSRPAAPLRLQAHNLPVQMTPFIGREEEQARLLARLMEPTGRLVTIAGPGGVGKTRLALAGAEQMVGQFADGVWFVSLAEVDPGQAGGATMAARAQAAPALAAQNALSTAIARALTLTFSGQGEPPEQLLSYLRHRQMLLLLDNFEHLLPGADFILALLRHAPQVRLLVTSRERLGFQAEHILGLKGLPVPVSVDVPGASSYSSVQLFAERAGRTPAGFVLGADNLPDVIHICDLVDGLPLGIELAASWVEQLGCASIAQTIVQNLDFMESSLRDIPERQRSMRAVFEGSWRLLAGPEQMALAHCAVFQGGFDEEAAGAVTGTTTAGLVALAGKSLLRRPASGRYEMHELLRQFAREKLDDLTPSLSEGGVYARHSVYYLNWLAQRQAALGGRETRKAAAEIRRDWGNVRQAWRCALEQGQVEAVQRSNKALAGFLQVSGFFREGADLYQLAAERLQALLPGAQPEVSVVLADVLVEQAGLLNSLGWSAQAAAVARQAVELARQNQAVEVEANAHLQRGMAQARQMDYAGAQRSGRLAQTLAWEAGSPQAEAGSLLVLGFVERSLGDYGVAQVYVEQARQLYRQLDDQQGEGTALGLLGVLASDQAGYAAARTYAEQARRIFHDAGDRNREGAVLGNLGLVAVKEGDYTAAWSFYEQALAILGETGDRRSEGSVLSNMAALLVILGEYRGARSHYEQALATWREIGYRQGEARVLSGMGQEATDQGDYTAAEGLIRQALALAREAGERSEEARAMNALGQALAGQGRLEEAAGAYWTALAQRRELGEQAAALDALAGQSRVALARHDLAQAQAYVEEIRAYLGKAGSLRGADDDLGIYLVCCQVLQAAGDPRARQILAAAHTLLEERAARIADPARRQSFLENVAVNREIARLYLESR